MSKTIYICTNCDAQFPKWSGRCLECGAWGTIEETAKALVKEKKAGPIAAATVIELGKIDSVKTERLSGGLKGFDAVVGGGLVKGSLVLLGGDPGVGKSTLALQLASQMAINHKVIYLSAEESAEQVALRLKRLTRNNSAKNFGFLHEDNLDLILGTLEKEQPDLLVIDSIQTIFSSELPSEAGSLNQLRACTVKLLEAAKKLGTIIILIGHVTKEGVLAGPKTMEHLVDVVVYLEGDSYKQFRLLRSVKNRFGSTHEVSVWQMTKEGLTEVINPSEIFLAGFRTKPGSVIAAVVEGSQVFLVEVQALVAKTSFGYPKRSASGFDQKRLEILTTILSKRSDVNLANFDVYLNLAGGLSLKEPALDLPVVLAIISAWQDLSLPSGYVAFGEVGLGGEIRSVSKTKERVKEAIRLGFKKIILPDFPGELKEIELVKVEEINDLLRLFK